jgi:hypothetical protein
MTVAAFSAQTHTPARPGGDRAGLSRLLRIELRRNAMVWLLPLLAAVFWLDTYRTWMSMFPVWELRGSALPDHVVKDLAAFAAGIAAWTGSREGRRGTVDVTRVTARAPWLRQGVTLAATTCWIVLAYLGCVTVLYGITAVQGAWGSPPLWPVAVGAAAVMATSALGFAAGVFWPNRFTAPLVAVGVEVLLLAGVSLDRSPYLLLTPGAGNLTPDTGAFYPYLPDLAIDQVMFLGGVAIAVTGVLGLFAHDGGRALRGSRALRGLAVLVTVVGLASAGTAAGLAGTARLGADGVIIPALHDAADDRPVSYTPFCGSGAVPICVNPAFRAWLPELNAAFGPAFAEVAGLPGVPVRANQIAAYGSGEWGTRSSGSPPVFDFSLPALGPRGIVGLQELFLVPFITGNQTGAFGTAAQQAVWLALLNATGYQLDTTSFSPAVVAASGRFGALSAGARHAWLARYLPALRAGHVTVEELP